MRSRDTLAFMGSFSSVASTALRWEVFSFLLSVCLAFGFGMQGARHYVAAKKWFWAGALLACTKILVWGIATSIGSSERITITAVLCATVGALLFQTLRWIGRSEKQGLQSATSSGESVVNTGNGSQPGDTDASSSLDSLQQSAAKDNTGAEYCYLMPMTVHDYRPASEGRPIAIMNPFDQPVYEVAVTIRLAGTTLVEGSYPPGSSEEDVSRTILEPGTVLPGLHVTELKLQPGTYFAQISTRIGRFSETLVIVRRNGKLASDFALTRLSDAHVLIEGTSLLKQKG